MNNNFYLIDKPLGISSFDIIRDLRKKLNIKKMGHTGTLDPLATGCVLIAIGNYTKLIPYLEKDTKQYEFSVNLDGVTDSFDLGEEIRYISEDKKNYYKNNIKLSDIEKIIKEKFSGEIEQIPPKYSALKIGGKRAYDLARSGADFEIKKRSVNILNIEVLSFKYPELSLKATVSAGTYIRSIASDLGEILGTGGYITKLRRTKIGNLDISSAKALDKLESSDFLDISKIFPEDNFVNLDDEVLSKLNNGLKVYGDFSLKRDTDLFIRKEEDITNIIKYDGEKLIPVRKI